MARVKDIRPGSNLAEEEDLIEKVDRAWTQARLHALEEIIDTQYGEDADRWAHVFSQLNG